MDKNIYEKTRYPGIKRNKKNKNYIVDICKDGIRTSISTTDGTRSGKKIFDINIARKIQQDPAIIRRVSLSIDNKMLIKDAWEAYLYDCEHNKQLKPRTIAMKKGTYRIYMEKSIGKKKIFEVKEDDILSIKIEIEKRNTKASAKYSAFRNVKSFFNWLVDREILDKSPGLHIRQFSKDRVLHPIWRVPEVNKFKEEVKKDFNNSDIRVAYKARMIYNLVNIDFALSARIGETRALQYKKVDFKNYTIEISSNIGMRDKIENTTKTDGSRDILYTPKQVIEELKEYIDWCSENLDMNFVDDTPLFFSFSNKKIPYNGSTVHILFTEYSNKAGLPHIPIYNLRHSGATLMQEMGMPMYFIQNRLRHKSIETTIDTYGTITEYSKKNYVNELEKYF